MRLNQKYKFLTPYGFATESPNSASYDSDGYWLGPIWAPSTILILDGLAACGEETFAYEVAERFCDLVTENGFAENFNALTGTGLRDLAYTWTPSVFLTLAHDYAEALEKRNTSGSQLEGRQEEK